MNCSICEKPINDPHDLILLHRAERIHTILLCSQQRCKEVAGLYLFTSNGMVKGLQESDLEHIAKVIDSHLMKEKGLSNKKI